MFDALGNGEDALDDQMREELARLTAEYRFFHWHLEFPHIFTTHPAPEINSTTGWSGGFSVVLGNPPWEHIELKEQEYFAPVKPEIATAAGAKRKKLIAKLIEADTEPDRSVAQEYISEKRHIDGWRHFSAQSGRFPLCGRGRIKTDPLFAEASRDLIESNGRLGMILPSGIATDDTTKHFFKDLVEHGSIASLYDFENAKPLFPGVHRSFKFCLLTLAGRDSREPRADFAFFMHDPTDLQRADARFTLTPEEIKLLNPNTGTCPVFRTRRDAEITLGIYRRVPILLREGDPYGNPWGIKFMQGLFNMTSDSDKFHTREDLEKDGWTLRGNVFERGDERMLPLYEGKMGNIFDHRFASFTGVGDTDIVSNDDHSATSGVLPRYWVAPDLTDERLRRRVWGTSSALLGFRRVARNTDERTCIAAMIPWGAASYGWILSAGPDAAGLAQLCANYNSFVFDFLLRQFLTQPSIPQGTFEQLPAVTRQQVASSKLKVGRNPADWIADRSAVLSATNYELEKWAAELGHTSAEWNPQEREHLRAELDAAFFHLYGIPRDDVDYIMDTFPIVKRKDEAAHGEYRTKRLILEIYDAMAEAERTGVPYRSPYDELTTSALGEQE